MRTSRSLIGGIREFRDLIRFNDVSPRLGFTVKLDPKGKTVGKASSGGITGRLNAGRVLRDLAWQHGDECVLLHACDQPLRPAVLHDQPEHQLRDRPGSAQPVPDQLFIGLEREVMPDLGIEVSYIRKKEHEFLRVDDVRGVYAPQPFVDTFRGQSQTLSVFNLQGASSTSLFQVTIRDDFRQDYNSVVLSAYKRLSSAWQLHGSYQWQQFRGYAGGGLGIGSQAFSGLGTGGFGRDPNNLTNAYGRFASDSTHSAKVNFAFEAPFGIHVGLRESFETGRPYGRLITVRGLRQGR